MEAAEEDADWEEVDAPTDEDRENLARYRKSVGSGSVRRFELVGEMTKLGRVRKSWRRRVFALDVASRCLLYFKDAAHLRAFQTDTSGCGTAILGCLLLDGARVYVPDYVEQAAAPGCCLEISVAAPSPRHYLMYADSEKDATRWVAALSLCGLVFAAPRRELPWLEHVHTEKQAQLVYGKQGFLEKRGYYNKGYKRRFMRVAVDPESGSHVLAYYYRSDSLTPRGVVPLFQAHVVDADPRNPDGVELYLKARERTYTLRARDATEKLEWLQALEVFSSLQEREPAPLLRVESVYARQAKAEAARRREKDAREAEARRLVEEEEEEQQQQQQQQQPAGAGDEPFRGSTRRMRERQREEEARRRLEAREARRGRQRAMTLAEEALRERILAGTVMTKYGRRGAPHARAVFAVVRKASVREQREERRRQRGVVPAEPSAAEAAADERAREAAIEAAFERELAERERGLEITDLCWCDPGKDGRQRKQDGKRCVRLLRPGTVVSKGKGTDVFAREVAASAPPGRCFSVDDGERTLDLVAVTEEERDAWVEALQWALGRV